MQKVQTKYYTKSEYILSEFSNGKKITMEEGMKNRGCIIVFRSGT
jgi:hypothetical protein